MSGCLKLFLEFLDLYLWRAGRSGGWEAQGWGLEYGRERVWFGMVWDRGLVV
jgi:hypothetical protein